MARTHLKILAFTLASVFWLFTQSACFEQECIPECRGDQACDLSRGRCFSPCADKHCDASEFCDASAGGVCKSKAKHPLPKGYTGASCSSDSECLKPQAYGVSVCSQEFEYDDAGAVSNPGGYCTNTCLNDDDCFPGTACNRACGPGESCSGACFASCKSDADCRDSYRCYPGIDEGHCTSSDLCTLRDKSACGNIGDDCRNSGDCIDGAFCWEESTKTASGKTEFSGFIDGYCSWIKVASDVCPKGSSPVPTSQDGKVEVCLKDCKFGDLDACSRGEACYPIAADPKTDKITTAVCYDTECATQADCAFAQCSGSSKGACGDGQPCLDQFGMEAGPSTRGTCSTRDTCLKDGHCKVGPCVDGLCVETMCNVAAGLCIADCRADPDYNSADNTAPAACGTLAICDPDSGACVHECDEDSDCGVNAYCGESGRCEARCHAWNEEQICGEGYKCKDNRHCEPE